jgi:hypothetical protein
MGDSMRENAESTPRQRTMTQKHTAKNCPAPGPNRPIAVGYTTKAKPHPPCATR